MAIHEVGGVVRRGREDLIDASGTHDAAALYPKAVRAHGPKVALFTPPAPIGVRERAPAVLALEKGAGTAGRASLHQPGCRANPPPSSRSDPGAGAQAEARRGASSMTRLMVEQALQNTAAHPSAHQQRYRANPPQSSQSNPGAGVRPEARRLDPSTPPSVADRPPGRKHSSRCNAAKRRQDTRFPATPRRHTGRS